MAAESMLWWVEGTTGVPEQAHKLRAEQTQQDSSYPRAEHEDLVELRSFSAPSTHTISPLACCLYRAAELKPSAADATNKAENLKAWRATVPVNQLPHALQPHGLQPCHSSLSTIANHAHLSGRAHSDRSQHPNHWVLTASSDFADVHLPPTIDTHLVDGSGTQSDSGHLSSADGNWSTEVEELSSPEYAGVDERSSEEYEEDELCSQRAAHCRTEREMERTASSATSSITSASTMRRRTRMRLASRGRRSPLKGPGSALRTAQNAAPVMPIILAALLSAYLLQPAGDVENMELSCASDFMPECVELLSPYGSAPGWSGDRFYREFSPGGVCTLNGTSCGSCGSLPLEFEETAMVEDHSIFENPDFIALLIRTGFILMEFGSRPWKNLKKVLSIGLMCIMLYHWLFGSSFTGLRSVSNLERHIAKEQATFFICFVCLRLTLKMADLMQVFKKHKDLRIVKLLKLAKLAKLRKGLGSFSFHALLKLLRMTKLLKLLKVSRKTKKLMAKRHYKAFKLLKAFKILKIVRLAMVVFCVEGAFWPVSAWSWTESLESWQWCPKV